mmetsp:Transcript_2148/g.2884  ORF Transcript_2148/g.2884 Transcript_2148/m.2884 type:complete len:242 (-) Transcript_2148:64-789(-)
MHSSSFSSSCPAAWLLAEGAEDVQTMSCKPPLLAIQASCTAALFHLFARSTVAAALVDKPNSSAISRILMSRRVSTLSMSRTLTPSTLSWRVSCKWLSGISSMWLTSTSSSSSSPQSRSSSSLPALSCLPVWNSAATPSSSQSPSQLPLSPCSFTSFPQSFGSKVFSSGSMPNPVWMLVWELMGPATVLLDQALVSSNARAVELLAVAQISQALLLESLFTNVHDSHTQGIFFSLSRKEKD